MSPPSSVPAGSRAEVVLDETSDEEREAHLRELRDSRHARPVQRRRARRGVRCADRLVRDPGAAHVELRLYIQQGGRVLRPHPGKDDALVLDHAGNTARFGLLEDFDPPTDLSQIDKKTDRRDASREVRRVGVPQLQCVQLACTRTSARNAAHRCADSRQVIVLDGELTRVEYAPGEELPGPTPERIQQTYRMLRHYGESKGMGNPAGWAWYATQRRYSIPETKARQLIPWHWRCLRRSRRTRKPRAGSAPTGSARASSNGTATGAAAMPRHEQTTMPRQCQGYATAYAAAMPERREKLKSLSVRSFYRRPDAFFCPVLRSRPDFPVRMRGAWQVPRTETGQGRQTDIYAKHKPRQNRSGGARGQGQVARARRGARIERTGGNDERHGR